MTNLDSILKSRDITLPAKVCLVKAMVFPMVMYGCESWTVLPSLCSEFCWIYFFSISFIDSLLFDSHSVVSKYLQSYGLQQTRLPYLWPSPEHCSNSCSLSQWCLATVYSVSHFSSCFQYERVTGRKDRGLQVEKEGCRCQTFLSLLSGRKKQTSNMFSSLQKFKRFLSTCCVPMTPGLT